jgi:hypothetical protein
MKKFMIVTFLILPIFAQAQSLYWVDFTYQDSRLVSSDLYGNEIAVKHLVPESTPQGLAFHPGTNHLFLVELNYTNANIHKGSNVLSMFSMASGYSALRNAAVDTANDKLYWTSSKAGANSITKSNLDGSSPETIIDFNSEDPGLRCIVLDVGHNKMYWSAFSANRIRSAALDGSNIATVADNLSGPVGLAIDIAAQKLYWTEINGNLIKRCDVSGSNIEILVDATLDRPNHLTLNLDDSKMYWTEDGNNGSSLKTATLDGQSIEILASDIGHPSGIVYSPTSTLFVNISLYLEGFYDSANDQMHTYLGQSGSIPTTSPFADQRSVSSIPENITDWVYVGLRSTPTGNNVVERSAFLFKDGTIVDDDGMSFLAMGGTPGDYYLVVQHRNHVSIMSSSAHTLGTEEASAKRYIFQDLTKAYGSKGMVELEPNIWGLAAGDMNQDGVITSTDYVMWYNANNAGASLYSPADLDGNSDITIEDHVLWQNNAYQGLETAVP